MEGFRILEITQPSEIHVSANQLTVEQIIEPKKKRKVSIPLEDLELIICTGANIRLSTMALSVLSENKIGVVIIGKDYMPSSIVFPYDANVRNAIIRDVVCARFYPAIGIHHEGPFNGFNLADDLIEPWRAMVDLVAHDIVSSQTNLSREQRKELTLVLHNPDLIKLPDILPVERIEVISE